MTGSWTEGELEPIRCPHGRATSWHGTSTFGEQLPEVEDCRQCNPDAVPLSGGLV